MIIKVRHFRNQPPYKPYPSDPPREPQDHFLRYLTDHHPGKRRKFINPTDEDYYWDKDKDLCVGAALVKLWDHDSYPEEDLEPQDKDYWWVVMKTYVSHLSSCECLTRTAKTPCGI